MSDSFADGLFFTTVQQGEDWFGNKKLNHKIMPVMEGSTFFSHCDRVTAKRKTGINGNPVFIWAGHLNANKDPLTVLDGFAELFIRYPEAKLVMIYGGGPLLPFVEKKINGNEVLQRNTILIGKIPHAEMEIYFNSSDYFVLGSHYEGSGYALSEALACGCIPVVTSIPSFRMLTDNGRLGAVWETGNKDSLIESAMTAINKPLLEESIACTDFFRRNLSFDAIATTAIEHYKKILERRSKLNNIGEY
jgi:glycosyltransferase involved in cell wall biosynthesis